MPGSVAPAASMAVWAALGLVVGAVLNHLADCLPQHKVPTLRPACLHCGQAYPPSQWIGVLALARRSTHCPGCGAPLSARRWLLEAGMAGFYGLLAWRYPVSGTLMVATCHASILALIVVTDLEARLVPNVVVVPAMALAAVLAAVVWPGLAPQMLLGGAVGFFFFLVLVLVYPRGMGWGDVKLAGYVGLIAGYPRILVCLLIAILAGGVAAAGLLLSGRGGWRSYMPYAPFLALGGALALLFL